MLKGTLTTKQLYLVTCLIVKLDFKGEILFFDREFHLRSTGLRANSTQESMYCLNAGSNTPTVPNRLKIHWILATWGGWSILAGPWPLRRKIQKLICETTSQVFLNGREHRSSKEP